MGLVDPEFQEAGKEDGPRAILADRSVKKKGGGAYLRVLTVGVQRGRGSQV